MSDEEKPGHCPLCGSLSVQFYAKWYCNNSICVNHRPAMTAWLAHLRTCSDCDLNRDFCGACEIGDDQVSEHGCNCPEGGSGYTLHQAAHNEAADVRNECRQVACPMLGPPKRCVRGRGHDGRHSTSREGIEWEAELDQAASTLSKASEDGVDRSEYFRQLFVAAYDAYIGTDQHGDAFGDDPRVGYGSGDKTPLPIESICRAERGRFGYERKVTLASIEAALSSGRGSK